MSLANSGFSSQRYKDELGEGLAENISRTIDQDEKNNTFPKYGSYTFKLCHQGQDEKRRMAVECLRMEKEKYPSFLMDDQDIIDKGTYLIMKYSNSNADLGYAVGTYSAFMINGIPSIFRFILRPTIKEKKFIAAAVLDHFKHIYSQHTKLVVNTSCKVIGSEAKLKCNKTLFEVKPYGTLTKCLFSIIRNTSIPFVVIHCLFFPLFSFVCIPSASTLIFFLFFLSVYVCFNTNIVML